MAREAGFPCVTVASLGSVYCPLGFLPALPMSGAKKESTDLTRSTFLFCCSRILLQPDDSLQILAPVEADVGFYTCNASNALGYDSVSIAVTLAGNVKTAVQYGNC